MKTITIILVVCILGSCSNPGTQSNAPLCGNGEYHQTHPTSPEAITSFKKCANCHDVQTSMLSPIPFKEYANKKDTLITRYKRVANSPYHVNVIDSIQELDYVYEYIMTHHIIP